MPSLNLRNALKRNPSRPTLKQRAAALKASAARVMGRRDLPVPSETVASPSPPPSADPRLLAMVAELLEARRTLNDPSVPDGPEADAIGERETALSMEVYRFPSRSIHDLAAKLPFFCDEAEDAGRAWDVRRGEIFENSLPGAAWAGLLRDIERLAGAGRSPPEANNDDLSLCSIRELARLYEMVSARWHIASVSMGAPFMWDGGNYNAAGRILDAECERLASMMEAIACEMKGREAGNEEERDDQLAVQIRQQFEGSGCVTGPALLAQINAAWKA